MSSKIQPLSWKNSRPSFQLQYSVNSDRWKFPKQWRWFVTIVVFSFMLCNGMNFNVLSGAIYCVEQLENDTRYEGRQDLPTYLAEKTIRSSLFGAYNWVTPLIILPTLLLCEYGGAEYVFLGARLIQGCLEFAIPSVFPESYIAVATIRAVQGCCIGVIYALMGPICQKHTFLKNIALVIGLSIGCFRAGISVPLIIAGELCKNGDWATDFYIVGVVSLTVSALWLVVLRFDSMKRSEIKHLVHQQASPLLKVLGSAVSAVMREYSTYCLMISMCCIHFCIFTVFTFGPKFYKDVYQIQLSKNRWYAIGPMLTPVIGAPLSGVLVQQINKILSFAISIKIVHTMGNLIPACTFFLIAFLPNLEVVHAMIILTTTFIFVAFFSVTVMRGAIAVKAKYSRLMSGLVTTAAFVGFVISPYVVETVTAAQTKQSWSTMWTICGCMFAVSWFVYLPIRFEILPKQQQLHENATGEIVQNNNEEERENDHW